jgi:phenylalanyl-tRNA synthetase alpha chain
VKESLEELRKEAGEIIEQCQSLEELSGIETAYLGKKGKLTSILKSLRDIDPSKRRDIGSLANEVKIFILQGLESRKDLLMESLAGLGLQLDITRPGWAPLKGSLHPVTRMMYDLNDAFNSLGFEIYQDKDITSEAYAFDFLNFPEDHPARESMDTYWIEGAQDKKGEQRLCLRPHLTGNSVAYMRKNKPPFRFVYPGRVYRSESTDASHERAFYQYEALMVDKEMPFSSGQLLVNTILECVFGRVVKTRMRAGFFPFVEPGFEIDMECLVCSGKGCSVCGRSGWVEMMPGGPPHPNVFQAGGIDPEQWQGFYINIGLDRLVMMKHGIDDIRLLHSGDLRFLQQF